MLAAAACLASAAVSAFVADVFAAFALVFACVAAVFAVISEVSFLNESITVPSFDFLKSVPRAIFNPALIESNPLVTFNNALIPIAAAVALPGTVSKNCINFVPVSTTHFATSELIKFIQNV